MTLWLIILAMGAVTYGLRLAPILLLGRFDLPRIVWRALRYVPPAVLSAIIFPDVFMREGTLDLTPGNARLIAGLAAALAAWRTKSVLLTIGVGLIVFWLVQSL